MVGRNLLSTVALFGGLLAAPPADACVCGGGWGLWDRTFPVDGAQNVPTDALFWANGFAVSGENSVVVEEPSGVEVAGTWSRIWLDDRPVMTFAPPRGWKPNTTYEVRDYRHPPEELLEAGGQEALEHFLLERVRFSTGEGPWEGRLRAPAATENVERVGHRGSSLCHEGDWIIEVQVDAPHDGVLLVLEQVGHSPEGGHDARPGEPAHLYGTSQEDLLLGTSICGAPWIGAQPGATASFRVGVYDVTGGLHWAQDPVRVSLPGHPACEEEAPQPGEEQVSVTPEDGSDGCQQGRGASSAGTCALLISGALLSRRRARRRAAALHNIDARCAQIDDDISSREQGVSGWG